MKPIPVRKVRALVKELAAAAADAPGLGFRFTIDGVYGVDSAGDLGLAAALEEDLPLEIPVDGRVSTELKRRWSSIGAGGWRLEIWRNPRRDGHGPADHAAMEGLLDVA